MLKNFEYDDKLTGARMRLAVGILAFLLPTVLLIFPNFTASITCFQPSISHNYYTQYREIFTGTLYAIGLFLICYKSRPHNTSDRRSLLENWFAVIAGIMALSVATFPTAPVNYPPMNSGPNFVPEYTDCHSESKLMKDLDQYTFRTDAVYKNQLVHYFAATSLFSILALFSFFIFPEKNYYKRTNRLFLFCGAFIVIGMAFCVIGKFIVPGGLQKYCVYIGEFIALYAFGISWLVKGVADGASSKFVHYFTKAHE